MNRFRKDTSGAALVEMALVLPILLLLTFGIGQFGLIYYAVTTMERAARIAARSVSVGEADDETSGSLTHCTAISGVSANGNKSAEQLACDVVANLPGVYSISANDGAAGGFANTGDDITVTVSVPRSNIILVDIFGLFNASGAFTRAVSLRVE